MHSAIKKTIETDALQDARKILVGIGPRLDELEEKLDRILVLLQQARSAPVQQQQGGGRR